MGAALLAGACAGLMFATKETAPLALGCMAVAFALTRTLERRYGEGESLPPIRVAVPGRLVLAALLAALLVSVVLLSSFLTHPEGIVDAARAYAFYFDRAQAAWWHIHPWDYYLRLLIHFRANGTPFWTEGLILGLAVVGGALGFTSKTVPGVDPRALRFLALYTLLMVGSYAAIPYKTPWCLLGFLQGMTLLAGAGAVFLVQACRGVVARALVVLLLSAAAAHLGGQAFASSFRFAADPRNPYVYAHTGMDVFEIAGRVMDLSRAHPQGSAMPVQFISRENLWPLPFYLRGLSHVTWSNGVADQTQSAPVIVVTPDMEEALARKLYDLPPPGERELYLSIFEREVELRPQVELRGYAAGGLWDEFRRLQAETPKAPALP
jgi:hypothetical protein